MISPRNVTVGEEYDVPCILGLDGVYYPVVGPAHVDGVDLCQNLPTPQHYHLDFRFCPFTVEPNFGLIDSGKDITYRRLPCFQERSDNGQILWAMIRLARAYQNHQINISNPICPHKKQNIVNPEGKCSGHGLCWNLETGRLRHPLPYYFRYKGHEERFPAIDRDLHSLPYTSKDPHTGRVTIELIDANDQIIGEHEFDWQGLNQSDTFNITTGCTSQ